MAASLAISAFWHLLVLTVLAMAVHPFKLPDESRAITVELLPPLIPPPPVEVRLPPPPVETPPVTAVPPAPAPAEVTPTPVAPPPPLEVAGPSRPVLDKPLEVERRQTAAKRLQTNPAAPQIPEAQPAPLELARPAPPLQKPIEVQRAAPAPALDVSRAAPALPQPAAPSEAIRTQTEAQPDSNAAPTPAPAQIQVLTNEDLVKAPIEIRPRDRTPVSPRVTTPAAPAIPGALAGGGSPPAGGSIPGAGAPGGARPVEGRITGGFQAPGLKGLRTTLGCASPDTYRLTPEERALCLQRLAKEAQNARELGINIPAAKQAEYDRYTACHRAYNAASIAPSGSQSDGTSVRGLGSNPSLKDCGPGDR